MLPINRDSFDAMRYIHDKDFRETVNEVMQSVANDLQRRYPGMRLDRQRDLTLREGSIVAEIIFVCLVVAKVADIVGTAKTIREMPYDYGELQDEFARRLEAALRRFREFFVNAIITNGRLTEKNRSTPDNYKRFLPLARLLSVLFLLAIVSLAVYLVFKDDQAQGSGYNAATLTEALLRIEASVSALRSNFKALQNTSTRARIPSAPPDCNCPECANSRALEKQNKRLPIIAGCRD